MPTDHTFIRTTLPCATTTIITCDSVRPSSLKSCLSATDHVHLRGVSSAEPVFQTSPFANTLARSRQAHDG